MAHRANSPAFGIPADVREPLSRLLHPGPSDRSRRSSSSRWWSAASGSGSTAASAAGTSALLVLAGLVIWTPTEYWLHRLVFHWQPKFRGGDRLHFMIHGVHHDHPNDAMRLVMPPAASIPLAALFLGLFVLIFGTPHAFPLFSGFIAGYLVYDYTHYHVHHHTPKTETRPQAARAAHAPPLPGPPLRLRGLLAAVGRGLPDPAAAPQGRAAGAGAERRRRAVRTPLPRRPGSRARAPRAPRSRSRPPSGPSPSREAPRRRADVRQQHAPRRLEQLRGTSGSFS